MFSFLTFFVVLLIFAIVAIVLVICLLLVCYSLIMYVWDHVWIWKRVLSDSISLDQIRTDNSYNLIALYDDHETGINSLDSPFQYGNSTCEYFEPDKFNVMSEILQDSTSSFHLNCRGLSKYWALAVWSSWRQICVWSDWG
jgi:hypothetical protein